nr:(2Fe-2S)-binding protein [Micromonospora sp. DSM 115978]
MTDPAGQSFRLTVNGTERTVTTHPDTPLLTVLRNDLGLTGARFGCGLGLCGACFVRMDGTVVAACDTPIWSAAGRAVVTVEGLADGEALHPVQRAMLDTQAAQCGYCLSGVLVSAAALLDRDPHPDEPAVAAALDRNLCRCGAHRRMIQAVLQAADGNG